MSSKLVKCASCNVVISEVLTFIQNKIEVMDEDSIQRICSTSFTTEEIAEAKLLLFESMPTTTRRVTRKGGGKTQRDIEDIICLFKETDPDITPIFVARNLNKLPPVTFDYVDASKLLKDIILLRSDIMQLKESCVTQDQLKQIKCDLEQLQSASVVNNFDFRVNKTRGAYLLNESVNNSGPMGMLSCQLDSLQDDNGEGAKNTLPEKSLNVSPSSTLICDTLDLAVPDKPAAISGLVSKPTSQHAVSNGEEHKQLFMERRKRIEIKRSSMSAKLFSQRSEAHNPIRNTFVNCDENEWTVVQKKKKNRHSGKLGCANSIQNFKAADSKVPIFISNIHRETKEQDITNYIKDKTGVQVSLIKLSQKVDRGHIAFKFFVPRFKVHLFMDEKLWPTGILFRRFINYYKHDNRAPSVEATAQTQDG